MKNFIRKGDVAIIVLVALVSGILMLRSYAHSGKRYANVYENGELKCTVDLSKNEEYEIDITGGRLLVKNGEICYILSECPDGTCESFGWLSRVGDTASCVPNRTVVTVVGEDKDAPDAITF
ncbi:MAG: NusG domain II-containing protein [Clostridia bacterium]|nr:NusG domain II-containing protein [Clostridia bacterium]